MASVLADHMNAARRRDFVGRDKECAVFSGALDASELPFHVLHVEGPPGIGKTTLLRFFEQLCKKQEVTTHYLDAHDIEPTPRRIHAELRRRTGLDVREEPSTDERVVLMIDSFEKLLPLERWFREEFIPRLPANLLLVLSSLEPLPASWRTDGGLQSLLKTLSLRNLRPEEAFRFLSSRGVPEEHHDSILRFAHGHPMALSLIADAFKQQPGWTFEPLESPDLVAVLLKRFIEEVPSPTHRAALEVAALARATTEPLLAFMLEEDDVRPLFEWLRGLSFIETTRAGLTPHDVAREVITTDLQWRNRERYDHLHHQARCYYADLIQNEPLEDPIGIITDYVFLLRDNPIFEPYFQSLRAQWESEHAIQRTAAENEDWPALRAMVERHEGAEAARCFDIWRERQPEGVHVFRDDSDEPLGFTLTLALEALSEEEIDKDPATRAAMVHLEEHAPLRGEERALFFRFWMSRDQHHEVAPIQSLITAFRVLRFLQTPRLAYTFVPCLRPEDWELMMSYTDFQPLPEAAFDTDGRHFTVFGHDWRATPPEAWVELLTEREITTHSPEPAPSTSSVLVLSRPAFEDAVKSALQSYAVPETLRDNPLLRSRLVKEALGTPENTTDEERIETLRGLLLGAAESLQGAPRETKFFRAVEATYLDPAPTQERAAEMLDVPFSTFRRHLRHGLEHITEVLWQQELGNQLP